MLAGGGVRGGAVFLSRMDGEGREEGGGEFLR